MRHSTELAGTFGTIAALLCACADYGQEPVRAPDTEGASITAELSVGMHFLTLTVTDDDGLRSSDEIVVVVAPFESPSGEPGEKVNYGVAGYSGLQGPVCASECHQNPNGEVPALIVDGPTSLRPGETGSYRLTLDPTEPTDQQGAGLDVAVDGGTLLPVAGQGTRLLRGEIVHMSPKLGTGVITWDYQWKAPSEPAVYRMFAASVSANLSDRDRGDETGTVAGYRITVRDPHNRAPKARAGADRTVVDTDDDGIEAVTLDGSASADVDGAIRAWEWSEEGFPIGIGATCRVNLLVGSHPLTLCVTDDGGLESFDDLVVIVARAGLSPPRADAGGDHTVYDVDGDGMETVALDGSASVDTDGTIVSWEWFENGDPVVDAR